MTVLQFTLSEATEPKAPEFRVEVTNPFFGANSWKVIGAQDSPLVASSGTVADSGGNLSLNLDAPVLVLIGANWDLAVGAKGAAKCELCDGVGVDWNWRVTAAS